MSVDLNVLAISYGRNLFDEQNAERARMVRCGAEVHEYHMVIFTHARDGLTTQTVGNLTLHPTNSRTKVHMLFDAYRIGKKVLKAADGKWVITAQDPFEAGLVGYLLARTYKLPLNVQEHGDFFSTPYWTNDQLLNRFRRWLALWLLPKADTVRVVTERILKTLEKHGVQSDRILLLPVRTDNAQKDAQAETDSTIRQQLPKNSLVVLTMARLVTQKNVPLLIRAFATLRTEVPAAQLVIVGKGPLEKELRQLSAELGLHESVTFLPWTDDPTSLLKEADIYALSSDWEGWGRVLIEAMVAGVPVVTTDVGCAGEVVKDGQHGFVVPVRDEEAFAAKLIKLAVDSTLREHFARQAQRDSEVVHQSLDAYATQWAEVLELTVSKQ